MSLTASSSLESPEPAPATARFSVRALADPSALARVLEQFVLRDLVPERVQCERHGTGDELKIHVEVAGLAEREADHLARRIRAFPVVTGVLLQRD